MIRITGDHGHDQRSRAGVRFSLLSACAGLSLLLAACGGDVAPTASPAPAAPATAATSADTPTTAAMPADTPAGGGAATTPAAGGAAGGTILFGAPLGITGSLSNESKLTQQGYELWKETVNAAGGINVGGKKYMI